MIRSRALPLLAVSVIVATACGSTAGRGADAGTPAPGSSSSAGFSLPPGTTTGGTTTAGGGGTGTGSTIGGTTTGGGTSTTGGSAPAGKLPTGQGGGGHLAAPPSVPGVTDTTIYVGSYYTKNQGAGNAAIGVGALDQGDARRPQNVMIDWVNSHGGVAGRKLAPVYYGFDASANGPSINQQEQEACATYFQDNEVMGIFVSGPILDECSKKAGAFELGSDGTPTIYKRYPFRIDIDSINKVRLGPVTVDGVNQHGWFAQDSKIGILTWDDADYHEAIDDGFLPALKKHGLNLATPAVYIVEPQNFQDLGATSAAVSNAVLKFSTLGIDHVFILDGPGGLCGGSCLTIEFLKRAESQQYYPRYGFNDTNSAIELLKLKVLSPRQAQGSLYVNWIDAGPDYEAGIGPNKTQQKCVEIMRKHDIDMSNSNSEGAALYACETMWFMQAAAVKMTQLGLDLTVPNFIAGVEALGYSYSSPLTYGTHLNPTQHDGIGKVRHARFVDGCSCYKWIGSTYKV